MLTFLGCQLTRTVESPGPALDPVEACHRMLHLVDEAVITAGKTDTSVFRIDGFPYLRTSRFLADMAARETNGLAAQHWMDKMHQLDQAAREKEILNLDNGQYQQLMNQTRHFTDRRDFIKVVQSCSERLFEKARRRPEVAEEIVAATDIPEEYRTWRRVVGLYPIVALPVAYASANAFDEFRHWHTLPPEKLPRTGKPVIYRPNKRGRHDRIDPQELYRSTRLDTLGLPRLTLRDERRLVEALAPVINQDTVSGYDRIGAVQWKGDDLTIAHAKPTGYYYLSHGRLDQRPSLQVNYVFWYSHRAGDNAPWIEWGRLDGLTVRISLDHTGRPAMLDIMNNCGCYHFFVPDKSRIRRIRTKTLGLDPLVPTWMPDQFPERRLQLRVNSGWHQVQNIGVDSLNEKSLSYELKPYRELEMLPDQNGRHRSMFDAKGIAWGSDRIEPVLFFSMGIPDVGSMRQRGHHAIKLVGRAHFDHPWLFDETFEYR